MIDFRVWFEPSCYYVVSARTERAAIRRAARVRRALHGRRFVEVNGEVPILVRRLGDC